jgi:hypothetical protein
MTSEPIRLVEAALAAIDEDSPRFRDHVAALLDTELDGLWEASPGGHASFGERALPRVPGPELRRLLAELRKLRRTALWAYGPCEAALQAKEVCSLDGIVCPIASVAGLPAPRGRECWVEVDSKLAPALLPALAPGWGAVICGELAEAPLLALRKLSRLRPLGVRVSSPIAADALARAHLNLDLALLAPNVGDLEALSNLAPRRLRCVDSGADLGGFGHMTQAGVLCALEHALEAALRLALNPP